MEQSQSNLLIREGLNILEVHKNKNQIKTRMPQPLKLMYRKKLFKIWYQ